MSYHARPLPPSARTPARTPAAPSVPETPDVTHHALPPTPDGSADAADRDAPAPSEPHDPRPWYRSEPWLAIELAAFLPMTAALVVPQRLRPPLVGLSALLVVLGLALLVRRRPSRKHPRPDTAPGAAGHGGAPPA